MVSAAAAFLKYYMTQRRMKIALIHDHHTDQTKHEGSSNDEDCRDDDHLLQTITNLGTLPPAMFEKWPCRRRYYAADVTDVGQSESSLGLIHIGAYLVVGSRKWVNGHKSVL